MEWSHAVVILLCVLCLPAALPLGSRSRSGSELPLRSGLRSRSELHSGSGSELPLRSGLSSRSELRSGSGSELPPRPELRSGLGSELPSGLELELPLRSGSELPSELGLELPPRSELPSGSGSELHSGLRLELPLGSGLKLPSRSGFELPSRSDLPLESGLRSGSESELPSGSEGSGSEAPLGLEPPLGSGSGSEPPSGSGSGSEPPSVSGLGSEPPSGLSLEPPPELGLEPALGSASFPLGLKAMVLVNATPCSVTCGPGTKEEQRCAVTPAGELRNCSLLRSRCLSDWLCGLQHLSAPQGKPFQLVCLSPPLASLEGRNFGYTWSFSQGLITTNDLLFHPIHNPSPVLRLSPALEAHSGTYRCDVQELSSFQIVKRIYFGLRVIPTHLVDLDFQKSLTWEQQQLLAGGEEAAGNGSGAEEPGRRQRRIWEMLWLYEVVLGLGSGVILGALLGLALCCLRRLCAPRAAVTGMNAE